MRHDILGAGFEGSDGWMDGSTPACREAADFEEVVGRGDGRGRGGGWKAAGVGERGGGNDNGVGGRGGGGLAAAAAASRPLGPKTVPQVPVRKARLLVLNARRRKL
jgi:hypothetical protein